MKYTLIRWLNGRAVDAIVQEPPLVLKTKKQWDKLPGNVAFKPYHERDDQIIAVAQANAAPLQPRY